MTDSLMIQRITPISTTCLYPELEYGSDLELELLPVCKETLDILLLTTWHAGSDETQEHLQLCGGTSFERRGLDLSDKRGLLDFWR